MKFRTTVLEQGNFTCLVYLHCLPPMLYVIFPIFLIYFSLQWMHLPNLNIVTLLLLKTLSFVVTPWWRKDIFDLRAFMVRVHKVTIFLVSRCVATMSCSGSNCEMLIIKYHHLGCWTIFVDHWSNILNQLIDKLPQTGDKLVYLHLSNSN